MKTDATFWDRIAPRYAKRPISNMPAYEATLARVRNYLKPSDRVLELGCGTGSTALLLADAVDQYVGSDFSAGMIAIAREKLAASGRSNLEFVEAGAGTGAFEGPGFDAVLAFNLLHLVPDLEGTLAEVHGLLPEGGLLISKTPCIGEKWYFRPIIAVMRAIGKPPFVVTLKIADLDRAVAGAGFEIVETGFYPEKSISRFIVARRV
jgi:ubiquinone/menaquinone biosynthesis C-methylase UbiE